MCGIVGFTGGNFNRNHLEVIASSLKHRGPDAEGYYDDEHISLGHRRLSILDLSDEANQPFHSQDGRYVMVYNGEVYNYRELAAKHKIRTTTTCDSEVLIELYSKLGTSFLHELNGMFAMAIWDKQELQLSLFRDRVGIKPLYYYYKDGNFAFASELSSFKQLGVSLSVNKSAIANYLLLGYIPEPDSIYNEIHKFPSGYFGRYKSNDLSLLPYWKVEDYVSKDTVKDEKEVIGNIDQLIQQSIEYRMISDVPFGTFLSGGIDSSLTTVISQHISELPVKTFSIGLDDASQSEALHAKKFAKHIGSEHYEFILSQKEALDQINLMLEVPQEPFADSSFIPTLLVSKMAKKHVSVALSGDGGDELFMGYGMYNWAQRLSNPMCYATRKLIAEILSRGNNKMQRASWVFNVPNKQNFKSHIFSQEQYLFSKEEIKHLLVDSTPVSFDETIGLTNRLLSSKEQQAIFDVKSYLKDDLLVKVDRASMYHSLEVRVPLLDHHLLEYALNIDESLKVKNGESKYVLKQLLYQYSEKSFFDRPKKGFSIPLADWLSKDLKFLIDTYLSTSSIEETGLFKSSYVHDLVSGFFSGKKYLYNRVWQLIVMQKWLLNNVK